jgi:S1-C subfamily serine protease
MWGPPGYRHRLVRPLNEDRSKGTPQVPRRSRRSHLHMSTRKTRSLSLFFVALAATSSGAAVAATRASESSLGTGVVVIDTNQRLEDTVAAGTGMVLTSSGRILTNNHVIAGATTIRVVLPNTTRRYAARVVGYDIADDVAVLQLRGAKNLRTITIGSSATLTVGASVTAIGNSGGFGRLLSARGRVIRLRKSVTVQNDLGELQRLTGLIETDAEVRPGDSGGPLLDSAGRVVGMNTAASPYGRDAFSVPIDTATRVTRQIVTGRASRRVHIAGTPFLGVRVQGTTVDDVVRGSPAAIAGLKPGDVLISIGGKRVTSEASLTAAVLAHKPGQIVVVVYTDETGATRSVRVRLANGPPQ